MWFPTKDKVMLELSSLHAHSKGMEDQLSNIAKDFEAGNALFGPLAELEAFQQEMADTTRALYLASASVFCEQVPARAMAKKLTFFRQQLTAYQHTISAMRGSITAIRANV